MKAKDQFIEWLKEKILENPQEPPAEAWQEISGALDLEESWERIEEELEFDTIWDKIDARLETYSTILKYERLGYAFSSAIAVVFLIGLFLMDPAASGAPFFTEDASVNDKNLAIQDAEEDLEAKQNKVNSSRQEKENAGKAAESIVAIPHKGKDNNQQAKLQPDKPDKGRIARKNQAENENRTTGKFTGKHNGVVSGKDDSILDVAATQEKNIRQPSTEAEGLLPDIESRSYLFDNPEDETIAPQPKDDQLESLVAEVDEEKSRRDNPYPSAYVGAGTAVKVSWLLNNKTLYAMEKNSLLSALPSYQSDWYLLYGTRLNNKLLLQADLYVKDVVGQDYQEYRNGQYGNVKDILYYQSLGLSLSRLGKQIGYGKYPTYVRLTGGIYGGRLQKAEELTFAGNHDKTNEYAKFHMGVLGGYEYDTFLGEHFIMSYGLRSRLDLLNIYSGTDYVPAAFRRTRAFSVDFTFSLKYILKK